MGAYVRDGLRVSQILVSAVLNALPDSKLNAMRPPQILDVVKANGGTTVHGDVPKLSTVYAALQLLCQEKKAEYIGVRQSRAFYKIETG